MRHTHVKPNICQNISRHEQTVMPYSTYFGYMLTSRFAVYLGKKDMNIEVGTDQGNVRNGIETEPKQTTCSQNEHDIRRPLCCKHGLICQHHLRFQCYVPLAWNGPDPKNQTTSRRTHHQTIATFFHLHPPQYCLNSGTLSTLDHCAVLRYDGHESGRSETPCSQRCLIRGYIARWRSVRC